jgi:predicted Zn-dependent peptidase
MSRPFSGEEAAGAAPPEVKQLPDGTCLSVEVLPEDWREALNLLVALMRRPRIEDAAVREYRTSEGYSLPLSNPGADTFRPKVELERILAAHPLAPVEPGRPVTPSGVRTLALRALSADQVVFGIGGAVSRADVEVALTQLTDDWKPSANAEYRADIPLSAAPAKPAKLIDSSGLSGWLAIGRVLGRVPESDQAPLAVMAEILDTRLNITTRETRGLTNRDMFMLPDSVSGAGLASVRTGARPESVAPLIKLSLEEVARLQRSEDPITSEELDRAKGTLLLGRWQAMLDGAPQSSSTYALEAVRRGSTDWLQKWPTVVEAVTEQAVRTAAQKYLPVTQMTLALVGPLETIRRARHPRWPVALDDVVSSPASVVGGTSR